MADNDSEINNPNNSSESNYKNGIESKKNPELINQSSRINSSPKWINNRGEEVKEVFGFNENAEKLPFLGKLWPIMNWLALNVHHNKNAK